MIIFLLIFFSPVEIYIRWSCNPFLSCRQPVRKSPLLWSPWQQPSIWAQAGFASWSGFDFYVVKAIIVDKGTGCFQLEIISGLEFHVCFGSLYWLNSPNEFTSACCFMLWWNGPRGLPAFWMLAFTLYWWWCIFQFSKKGVMLQITFWIIGDLPSSCSLSSGPLFLSSSFCDVLKNTDLWPLNRVKPIVSELS